MDFKQLFYIVKVAECQNITKAARELYISQPSLSQFVSKAEEELGVKLFDRSTNPLTLTYAGKKYVEAARHIIDINENAKKELQDIAGYEKGLITLGIPRERGSYMLPLLLKEFMRTYPGIEIKVLEQNTNQILEQLKYGRIDMAFVPDRELGPELDCEKIYEEELLFVVGDGVSDKSWCLDGYSNVINWKKAGEMPFVILKEGHGSRRKCEEIFKKNGVSPKILMETSSNLTALRMAEEGIAAAIVPEMTVRLFQGARRFNTYFLERTPVTWQVLAVWRKEAYQNRAQRDFIRMAREIFGQRPPLSRL